MGQTEIHKKQILIVLFFPAVLGLLRLMDLFCGNGSGYFLISLQICLFPIGCFMVSFPQVTEKLIRSRMSKGQYKNADRVWKCAMIYGILAGTFFCLLLYGISAPLAQHVFGMGNGLLCLRLLIPITAFLSFSFVLKGYFQGMGSGLPGVVCDSIFFLCAEGLAVLFIRKTEGYGQKVAALLQNGDFEAMYTTAGAALGITIGSAVSVLLLLLGLLVAGRNQRKYIREGMKLTEDYSYIVRLFFFSMLPYILAGVCLYFPLLGDIVFLRAGRGKSLDFVRAYGDFYREKAGVLCLCILPILPGMVSLAAKYVTFVKKEEYKHARDCMQGSLVWIFATAGFVSAALWVFGEKKFGAAAVIVFTFVMAFFFGLVLWKLGNVWEMTVILALAGAGHLVLSGAMLNKTSGNTDWILYSFLLQTVLAFLGAAGVVQKKYPPGFVVWKQQWKPVLCTAVSGFFLRLLESTGSFTEKTFGVIAALLGGMVLNWLLTFFLKSLRARELYLLPGGKIILAAAKRLHI